MNNAEVDPTFGVGLKVARQRYRDLTQLAKIVAGERESIGAIVASMIALFCHGSGFHSNRQADLWESLGTPLPVAAQCEIVVEPAARLHPLMEGFIRQAAQGQVLHTDDTSMPLLRCVATERLRTTVPPFFPPAPPGEEAARRVGQIENAYRRQFQRRSSRCCRTASVLSLPLLPMLPRTISALRMNAIAATDEDCFDRTENHKTSHHSILHRPPAGAGRFGQVRTCGASFGSPRRVSIWQSTRPTRTAESREVGDSARGYESD